jgi:hypothetical protein
MARSVPAGYAQKALLYHLLELGEGSLKVLVAEAGVVAWSANQAMQGLVQAGLATKTPYAPGSEVGDRSWTYGITRKGAEHAMALEPADGYPDGIPAHLM